MKTLPRHAVQFYTKDDTAKTISSDGSLADTQNAINYVAPRGQDDWVLTVGSAGASYGWGSALSINFARIFTIKGGNNPSNRPTIHYTGGGGAGFGLTGASGKTVTVKDFIIGSSNGGNSFFSIGGAGVDCFRISNIQTHVSNWFAWVSSPSGSGGEGPYGLFDNCTWPNGGLGIFARDNPGHTPHSWRRPMTWGTKKAIYVENCTFNQNTAVAGFPALDGNGGVRYVVRHCSFRNFTFTIHGPDSGGNPNDGLSGLQVELMHCTFTIANNQALDFCFFLRGGTATIFDNTVSREGNGFYNLFVKMYYYRATPGNGLMPVDRFHPQDYLGTMQPGSGTDGPNLDPKYPSVAAHPSARVPIYCWGNRLNAPLTFGEIGMSGSSFAQLNRDYFKSPRPGYTEFTYPHPLRGQAGEPTPPSNILPDVGLTSPTNNAQFYSGDTIPLTATASDPDGTIAKVEYFNGDTEIGESTTAPSYPVSWTNVAAGTYPLKARATDNIGDYRDSAIATVKVDPVLGLDFASTAGRITAPFVLPAQTSGLVPRTAWSVHYVDSQNLGHEATKVFDGNSNTIWHTQWEGAHPPTPHEIQINMGASYTVEGLKYLPRQDSWPGRIGDYEIYVSANPSTWGTAVATGSWTDTAVEQTVNFSPKTGQYIRLKALTEVTHPFRDSLNTAIAELNVLQTVSGSAGTISQSVTVTDPAQGGRAEYVFSPTVTGDYIMSAMVNGSGRAFAIRIDNEPTSPLSVWHVPQTTDLESRTVTWDLDDAGSGRNIAKKWSLVSGQRYTLIVLGLNTTALGQITFTQATGSPPSAPTGLSPAHNATGVSLTPTLSWTAATGATSYDVLFGVENPPVATVSPAQTGTTHTPQSLTAETDFYYQVISRNINGSTPSAVLKFTTAALTAPAVLSAPSSLSPANAATNVPIEGTVLRWVATPLTEDDTFSLRFGTSSPPPEFAAPANSQREYALMTLHPGARYFWDVAITSGGSTERSSTQYFDTASLPPPSPPPDVPVVGGDAMMFVL